MAGRHTGAVEVCARRRHGTSSQSWVRPLGVHYSVEDIDPVVDGIDADRLHVPGGLLLAWTIEASLISTDYHRIWRQDIVDIRRRRMTGPELFRKQDGKLHEAMFNDKGNAFLHHYLRHGEGRYLDDVSEVLAQNSSDPFAVADTWENYDRLRPWIDSRFQQWTYVPSGTDEAFEFILGEVASALEQHGFRRSGQELWRQVGQDWQAIRFDRSWKRFSIILGIASGAILAASGTQAAPPSFEDCESEYPLGLLLPGAREQFYGLSGSWAQRTSARVIDQLVRIGLPYLDGMIRGASAR